MWWKRVVVDFEHCIETFYSRCEHSQSSCNACNETSMPFCIICIEIFHFYTGGLILITPGEGWLKMGKWKSPIMGERKGFQCLGHSNWTICSLLSWFCSTNFPTFSLLYWEANSYYPRRHYWEKGILPTRNMDETEEFQCLGHSNWTICSLLGQFCFEIFPIISLLYWRPILITPEGQ